MKSPATRVATAVLMLLGSAPAWPLGFATAPDYHAVLGRPVDVSFALSLDGDEALDDKCVSAEVFYGDTRVPAAEVRVQVQSGVSGQRVLRVRTSTPVDEPVVSVAVTAGCQPRFSRKIVAFADPPAARGDLAEGGFAAPMLAEQAQPSGDAPVASRAGQAGDTRVAQATSDENRRVRVHRTRRQEGGHVDHARAATIKAAQPVVPQPVEEGRQQAHASRDALSARVTPRVINPDGSHLSIDPVEMDALGPQLRLATSVDVKEDSATAGRRAAASAIWKALNTSPEEVARQGDRLAELQKSLDRLKAEGVSQGAVNGLQARLEDAQRRQYSNPLTWLLGVGLLAALAALGTVLARRKGERAEGDWWKGVPAAAPAAAQPVADPRVVEPSVAAAAIPDSAPDLASPGEHVSVPVGSLTNPFSRVDHGDVVVSEAGEEDFEFASRHLEGLALRRPDAHARALQQVSVDELLDLEQQTEFFFVLGQDQAAIDLLQSHIEANPGTSPLPFLRLLEAYQRRGSRAEYEALRQVYDTRFSAFAPPWDSHIDLGRSLTDYPAVWSRITSIWSNPRKVLDLLNVSLVRKDGASVFDLPAYREMILLYGVARDLADRADSDDGLDIDLSAAANQDPVFGATTLEPLLATAPLGPQVPVMSPPSLGIDLDLDGSHRSSGPIDFDLDGPHSASGSIDFDLAGPELRRS